ncbi:MAG: class A beta-lactamase-related serine hydrolase, partial [Acidobacteria bacterium]
HVKKITVLQLLAHRSGFQANLTGGWGQISAGVPIAQQRLTVVEKVIREPLECDPGCRYLYSNLGYVVAAAMAEKSTGREWERLISTLVFEPLGMTTAGFGGLGTPGKIDKPWPHFQDGRPAETNGPAVDNPPVLAPAGTVHCSLADWAKFIGDQLKGELGQGALLRAETYRKLHTPPFGGDYGLGWLVVERPWGGGPVYTHSGSNTMNFAVVWIAPLRDLAIMAVTNQGGSRASSACDRAVGALIGWQQRRQP